MSLILQVLLTHMAIMGVFPGKGQGQIPHLKNPYVSKMRRDPSSHIECNQQI